MEQLDELFSVKKFFLRKRGRIILAVIAVIISSSCLLPIGFLTQMIIDDAIQKNDLEALILFTSLMIGLILIHLFGTIAVRKYISRFIKQYLYELRILLCNKVLPISRKEAEMINISKQQVKIVAQIERIDVMLHAIIVAMFPAVVMIAGLLLVLFFINFKLTILVVLIAPLLGILIYVTKRKRTDKINAYHNAYDIFNFQLLESLRGLFLLQDEALQNQTLEKLKGSARELKDSGYKLGVYGFNQSHIHEALITIMGVSVLIFGGLFIFYKYMTIGELLSFYFVVFIVRRYFNDLVRTVPQVQEGILSYKSISDELKNKYDFSNGDSFPTILHSIQLKSVHFWHQADKEILSDLNFTFEKGKKYLITGENGSGKTTLFNLLTLNYLPQKGHVYMNDLADHEIDKSGIKTKMGILPQSPIFFDRSIRDNILMGRQIEEETFLRVVRFANVQSFVDNLPQGFNTKMGDKGVFFSGGQKQKIALARTLVKTPDFILLDEPTNHLDRQSINWLISSLSELEQPPGVIIISHDETMKSIADVVLLIENRSLIEKNDR